MKERKMRNELYFSDRARYRRRPFATLFAKLPLFMKIIMPIFFLLWLTMISGFIYAGYLAILYLQSLT